MTGRLADISDRIEGIRQLGAVVNAMRGIAAARAQQARTQLVAVDRYAQTIAAAVGHTVALVPVSNVSGLHRSPKLALVVFCAEQGFAGAFSERVLDGVGADLAISQLFLVGTRGATALSERGIAADWACSMPSHSPGIPKLADGIVEALYPRIADGRVDRLEAVFSRWQAGRGTQVERRSVFPIDPRSYRAADVGSGPLLNLGPDVLLGELAADNLHAQLCRAGLQAFAAENQARMEAMAAARTQIERQLSSLQATQRLIRQEEITAEIIELAAGEAASRSGLHRRPVRQRRLSHSSQSPEDRS